MSEESTGLSPAPANDPLERSSAAPPPAEPVWPAPEAGTARTPAGAPEAGPLIRLVLRGLVIFFLGAAVALTLSPAFLLLPGLAALFVGLLVLVRGVETLVRTVFWRGPLPGRLGTTLLILQALLASFVLAMLGFGATFAPFLRGRQLRRRGKLLLPALRAAAEWTQTATTPTAPLVLRRALAAQWRENGRTEHASVAAFAQHTLELIALGAPPRLLEAAQRDALDETRHAQLCFSHARALDGQQTGPAPFPEARWQRRLSSARGPELAQVAREALVEGALLEGASARVLARLARGCPDTATRALLEELCADEGRHSSHGWDVVEWCLAEGGAEVARALESALVELPAALASGLPQGARDGSWEAYGIAGERLEAAGYEEARAYVSGRVSELVAAARASCAAAA